MIASRRVGCKGRWLAPRWSPDALLQGKHQSELVADVGDQLLP
jgi:hypothetical protein